MLSRSTRLLAALCLAGFGGCDNGLAPEPPPFLYVLVSVDGRATPWRAPAGTYEVIADSLFFDADGTGLEVSTVRSDIDGEVRTSRVRFTWTHDGSRIELWGWCLIGGFVPCPAEPTYAGRIVGDHWLVDASWRFPTPIVFRGVE